MSPRETDDAGSFSTGFTLGLFAGAAGFFLFGTRDGQKVRTRLAQEWQEAKERIIEEVGEDGTPLSLQDLALAAKKRVLSVLDGMAKESQRSAHTSKAAHDTKEDKQSKDSKDAVSKRTAKKKRLFKGVS